MLRTLVIAKCITNRKSKQVWLTGCGIALADTTSILSVSVTLVSNKTVSWNFTNCITEFGKNCCKNGALMVTKKHHQPKHTELIIIMTAAAIIMTLAMYIYINCDQVIRNRLHQQVLSLIWK